MPMCGRHVPCRTSWHVYARVGCYVQSTHPSQKLNAQTTWQGCQCLHHVSVSVVRFQMAVLQVEVEG